MDAWNGEVWVREVRIEEVSRIQQEKVFILQQ